MLKVIKVVSVNLAIIIAIELFSALTLFTFSNDEKDYFCDVIHTNEEGQKFIARELYRNLSYIKDSSKLWFFGGSTTKSSDCGIQNNYPFHLSQLDKKLATQNFAQDGTDSKQNLEKLKNLLLKQQKPNVVFWASWVNDLKFFDVERPNRSAHIRPTRKY